jgi:hypothetical protein
MRKQNLTGIAIFHTHPPAGKSVGFSGYDDQQEPRLVSNLVELAPKTTLLSVVVGRDSQCARVWQSSRSPNYMGEMVTVGESIKFYSLNGQPPPPAPRPSEIFDRAKSITDAGALQMISNLRFGVVGASGTGSLICELLARAGARHIMLIDDDIIKAINLNRILHSTKMHARKGRSKVAVIKDAIEAIGIGCNVEAVNGTILDRDVLLRLKETDLIFGCVDAAIPRLLLSQFAYQYLRPLIDLGTEIGGDNQGIASLDARVSYVAPGRHCLKCTGLVTPRQLRFEGLSMAERMREAKLGYSDDLLLEQPAVMDLNMRAASFAMVLVRHLLQPFLLTPLPVAFQEGLLTYSMKTPTSAKIFDAECSICQKNPHFGFGDDGPALAYDKATVQALLGKPKTVKRQNWFSAVLNRFSNGREASSR